MKKTEEDISKTVAAMARELDAAPSGEAIIERLLTGQILLQRENAELKAKLVILTALVDSDHAAILVLQGQRLTDSIVQ
jgi:hypothetical protein